MIKYLYCLELSLFLLFSCHNSNVEKFYYDTGELKGITKIMDQSQGTYTYKEFYKNGILKEEGIAQDGHPIGHWKKYYGDGVLKWEGDYTKNGNMVISSDTAKFPSYFLRLPNYLEMPMKRENAKLKVGENYKFRVLVHGIEPSNYLVVDSLYNLIPTNKQDSDTYPYIITPGRAGKLHILVLFPNEEGHFLRGKPYLSYDFLVEK